MLLNMQSCSESSSNHARPLSGRGCACIGKDVPDARIRPESVPSHVQVPSHPRRLMGEILRIRLIWKNLRYYATYHFDCLARDIALNTRGFLPIIYLGILRETGDFVSPILILQHDVPLAGSLLISLSVGVKVRSTCSWIAKQNERMS